MRTLDHLRRAVRTLAKVRQAQTLLVAADVPCRPVERVQDLIAGARARANRLRSGILSQPPPVPRQETVSRRLHAPHSPPV
jgi:crotonobetainyl-CoA:carnitine CoA-transferase CaiB-like acyl-CoA transferase